MAAVAPLSGGRTPVLALNFLADSVSAAPDFYQFALLPEDEARSVARRLVADGKLKGVAIIAERRMGQPRARGVRRGIDAARRHDARRRPLRDRARRFFRHHQADPAGARRQGRARRRTARTRISCSSPATAGAARLIVPQLKFNYAGDDPRLCHVGQLRARSERQRRPRRHVLPDMPWMVSADPVTDADPRQRARGVARAHRPARPPVRLRLRRLSPGAGAARRSTLGQTNEISGVTGKLFLDSRIESAASSIGRRCETAYR